MKRKASPSSPQKRKRQQTQADPTPDYCDAVPQKDASGEIIWPSTSSAMSGARQFVRDAATSGRNILLVPDKDADGLSAGAILYRTFILLGVPPTLLSVYLLSRGTNVHDASEREAMSNHDAGYVVVLDQGSRSGPKLVSSPADARTLVIDHHHAEDTDFPDGAEFVTACHYPPVATASLLTWEICRELHPDVEGDECAYLCAIGTTGDLSTALKWKPPFPDMTATFKTHTKKAVNDAVSLLNAPRRTAKFDVRSAWDALIASRGPKDVLKNGRLLDARAEINAEVERHTHTPPKFSKDGRIAVLRIDTPAQVHPVIATRWAGFLKSAHLEVVMVANSGYSPGMVNFSCRIAKCARGKQPPVNIIETLKDIAALDEGDLVERMGESFARGHKEASGGIIPTATFEELMGLIKLGEKPDKPAGGDTGAGKKKTAAALPPQKNSIKNYFAAK